HPDHPADEPADRDRRIGVRAGVTLRDGQRAGEAHEPVGDEAFTATRDHDLSRPDGARAGDRLDEEPVAGGVGRLHAPPREGDPCAAGLHAGGQHCFNPPEGPHLLSSYAYAPKMSRSILRSIYKPRPRRAGTLSSSRTSNA